jgi:large subunit ribosomal protein L2
MILKYYNPYTSSMRHTCLVNKNALWKGKPLKSLIRHQNSHGGRNHHGCITIRGRSSFIRPAKRIVNLYLNPLNFVPGVVNRIEYDPARSSFIMLVRQYNGTFFYMIAPDKIKVGDPINVIHSYYFNTGFFGFLKDIPVGTVIHNLELYRGKGSQLIRSAGCFGQLIKKNVADFATVRLSSGQRRIVSSSCVATIGTVSNGDFKYVNYGKAGRIRYLGMKPTVRGVAMNPVDHPHGGGEGKTSGGRPSVSPWSKITKKKKTRKIFRNSRFIIETV